MISRIYKLLYRKFYPLKYWKKKGLIIGKNCRLVGEVNFGSEPYLIKIGDHVSITNSKFVTHDGGVWVFREKYPKIDLFGTINIGNNVFIGVDSIILPGTIIEDNVVVGAGSIVKGKLESNSVYAGQPAKKIKNLNEYFENLKNNLIETKNLKPAEKKKYILEYFNENR